MKRSCWQDLTVAAPQKWAAGASGEYWYIAGPYKTPERRRQTVSNGSDPGSIPGGNFFIGYDKLTVQYSHREGTLKVDQKDIQFPTVNTHSDQSRPRTSCRFAGCSRRTST